MIKHHLKIALRSLSRKRGYTFTNVLGLSIGITSCLLILLFVLDEVSYDQYHVKKDRIYLLATVVNEGIAKVNGPWGPASKREIPEVESMTRFVMAGQQLVERDQHRFYETSGFYSDSTVFDIFSFELLEGDAHSCLTAPQTVVLTKTLAVKYFPEGNALGRDIEIENQRYRITGILKDVPDNSHFTFTYLLSMASLQHPQRDHWIQWNQFYTYLLLNPGAQPDAVAKKVKGILERNMDAESAGNYKPFLQRLTDIHLYSHLHREIRANSNVNYIYVFSAIAVVILLISCANFVNLATAQATVRGKEIGVRKVNGAVSKQLIAQFMLEAFLITAASVIVAIGLATLTLPVLNELTLKNISFGYFFDLRIIVMIVTLAVVTTLLAGSYPAFFQSALKPIEVLKSKWAPSGNSGLRKALVVFQFVLSSLLIIASVVILQQLSFIQNKSLGFDPHQVITIPIQADVFRTKMETVRSELLSHPGVLDVSLSGNLPGGSDWGIPSLPEGFTSENVPPMRVLAADPFFVKTFGMNVIAGRDFDATLSSDSATYLINEEAARQLGWENPLTKTISMPAAGRQAGQVVGVIKDFHFRSMHEKISPILFMVPPREWFSLYSIRIDARQTDDVLKFIETKWSAFDPEHPFTYRFFDVGFDNLHQQEHRLAEIVGYFTAIGIFLACLGLYSLASITTAQRRKEIGIRKVVGASVWQILALLSKQYVMLVITGFMIAVPLAWWAIDRWLDSFAYRLDLNLWIMIACAAVTLTVALTTVMYRSMIAAAENPVKALRNE